MSATGSILEVGLTGGIGSGKSTAAAFLEESGAFVVDADRLAREVVTRDGPAYEAVKARFGEEILAADGELDRAALAARVFADAEEREALNSIVHPHVRAQAAALFASCAREGRSPVAVLDAALLVETGAYRDLHRVIVVRCSEATQVRRLLARGMEVTEAESRIAAQAPLGDKLAVADYVVDTEGTLENTRRQLRTIWSALLELARQI